MGSKCIGPSFLDLGNSWRWVVSFTPLTLYLRGRATGTHWIGGWMDPRTGVDDMEKWKFLTRTSTPRSGLQSQPVAISTMLPRLIHKILKSKAIPLTRRGGLYGCEMLRISHCLDNRLTDGSKIASTMHRSRVTAQKHFCCFWCSFLLEAE
jgi:hypothetical protein